MTRAGPDSRFVVPANNGYSQVVRQLIIALAFLPLVSACDSGQQPPAASQAAPPVQPAVAAPVVASSAFSQVVELQGVSFTVECPNDGPRNTLTVTPAGLEIDNSRWSQEVDGVVIGAEVADLNVDGSPEVYVYVRSPADDATGSVVGYVANNRKSLSMAYLPPLSDTPHAVKGYRGQDEFAVLEGVLGRRFPIHDEGGAPTGKFRQLQYKLTAGEAGWILALDTSTEF